MNLRNLIKTRIFQKIISICKIDIKFSVTSNYILRKYKTSKKTLSKKIKKYYKIIRLIIKYYTKYYSVYLKKQKKIGIQKIAYRKITNFRTESFGRILTAIFLILLLVFGTYSDRLAHAATYTFSQTSWLGGVSVDTGVHPTNQSSWNKFSAQDANLVVVNAGAGLQLSTTTNALTQTNDGTTTTGFNLSGASLSSTIVSGTGTSASIKNTTTNFTIPMIATGDGATYALKSDGTVWAWGDNSAGQLGDNSVTQSNTPIQVHGTGNSGFLTGVISLAANTNAAYALKSDGTVWSWGINSRGQLGDNTITQRKTPVQVLGLNGLGVLSGITAITASKSGTSAYALKSDGTVWAWGENAQGQLGDNFTADPAYTPVKVLDVGGSGYLTGVSAISAGQQFAMALKSDGTVWSWGYNATGQLGNNTTAQSGTPVQVHGTADSGYLVSVSYIANTLTSSYALLSDGTVWSWGSNGSGKLGDNTTTQRNTPVQVHGTGNSGFLTSISAVSGGASSVMALKSDGAVWTWGDNSAGQLGDNSTTQATTPIQVHGTGNSGFLTSILAISGGQSSSYGIKSDGTVWSWGLNTLARLGDNTTTQRNTPVQVHGVADSGFFDAGYLSYSTSGTYTSGVIDLTIKAASFSTISFNKTTPTNTSVSIDMRAGDSTNTSDGSWTSWQTGIASGGSISSHGSHRYVQYKVTLTTSDTSVTPSLEDLTFNYNTYPTTQSLTSSAYDTTDSGNIIGAVGMNEDATLPTGTTATISLRTASSQVGLSSAVWYDFTNATTNCTKVDTLVYCPVSAIPSALKSGGDDKWWQYKITLTSTGPLTATISGVEIKYVVNATPELQNVTATQGTDGLVNISYDVRDSDTLAGSNTPGYVTPSFEYWNGTTWVSATTFSAGATSNKTVNDSTFTTYTLTWNPKTDYNTHYSASAKIRVTVNDNEAANNTVSAETTAFTLDTTDPVVNSFVLDARVDAVNDVTISVSENSLTGLKMKISNNSDLSVDSSNLNSGTWIDYASTASWIFSGDNPVVYYQIKDIYGNISNNSVTSSVSMPARPLNILYQDVSTVETSEWREFVAWGKVAVPVLGFKQYNIYRSIDGTNYSLLSTQVDRTINFILDTSLDTSITYYYRVSAEDNAGNNSLYSSIVNDRPDGQGGSDLTPPVISNVAISSITAQSALVTWDTDEPSNSSVNYITNNSGDFTNAPSVGVTSMLDYDARLGHHSVFLNNLTSGVTYYIQVTSSDPNSNLSTGGEGMSFQVLTGPVISSVASISVHNTGATITWTTSEASDSHVFYSTDVAFAGPTEVSTGGSTTSHSVNLTGLTPGVTYYYYVKSGVAEDKNIVSGEIFYYNFTATSDVVAPVITFDAQTNIYDVAETTARISWTTNELATSSVEYSTDNSYGTTSTNANLNTNHDFQLTGLTRGTLYNFRIKSTDTNNNLTTQTGLTFTTLDLTDVTPPVISSLLSQQIFDTSAVISWNTNEPTDALVEYGTASNTYIHSAVNALSNYTHSIILTGLDVSTMYYFKVTSVDSNTNSTSSVELSFTTLALLTEGSSGGGGTRVIDNTDRNAPTISDVLVKDVFADKATVTWNTNEASDSAVEFGPTENYGFASINRAMGNTHSQTLTNLDPDTLYYYKVTSADSSGNLATPYLNSFLTLSFGDLPDISDIDSQEQNDSKFAEMLRSAFDFIKKASKTVSLSVLESSLLEQRKSIQELASLTPLPVLTIKPSIKLWEDMAIISWETDKKTNSVTAFSESGFALTNESNAQVVGNPDIYSLKHQVVLSGLKPETKYNYQLRGSTLLGAKLDFPVDAFTTLSKSAKVENYVADRLGDDKASFKWSSSLETNTSVRTTPYRNNSLSSDEAKVVNNIKLTSIHEMTVSGLEPGVFYKVDLFGNDASGRTLSQSIEAFSTSSTELPFLIEQVKTSSALATGENLKVQSIISWNTTKLSTSKVYYRKGTSKDDTDWPFESVLDSGYTRHHLVVMTDFGPGEVYQFQAESMDSNGQKVRSKSFTILTPRQKESVFQVIFKNIEQTFGWVGGVKK